MKQFCTQCNGSTRHANKCIVKQLETATKRIKSLEDQVRRLVQDTRDTQVAINPMDYL